MVICICILLFRKCSNVFVSVLILVLILINILVYKIYLLLHVFVNNHFFEEEENQKEKEIQKDNSSNTTNQDKEKDLSNSPPVKKEVDSKTEKEISTNDVPVVDSSEEKLPDKSDNEDM